MPSSMQSYPTRTIPNRDSRATVIIRWGKPKGGAADTFESLRNDTQTKWGHLLSHYGQFWGISIEKPCRFFWIISFRDRNAVLLFQQHPEYDAFLAGCSSVGQDYTIFVGPILERPLLSLLTKPVTAFSYFVLHEERDIGAFNELIASCVDLLASRNLHGYHGYTWVLPLKRGGAGVFIGGWDTVEQHNRMGKGDEELVMHYEELLKAGAIIDITHTHFKRHPPPPAIF